VRDVAEIEAVKEPLAIFRRRDVLGGLLGLAGAPVARSAGPFEAELPKIPAAPIHRPEPGIAEVTIQAIPARVSVAGRLAALWTYGGTLPGPLIEARAGDTVRLHFTNRLPEPTNLHFHGLHVTPDGHGDNIWLSIAPREALTYELALPANEGGLFWYHPHPHHRLAHQLWQGLAGPLVIRTPIDTLPELVEADERVIMLRDLALENGIPARPSRQDWNPGKSGDLVLVNGVIRPVLEAQSGLLWLRLINAANARYLLLALADGRPFHLIATDGRFLEQPMPHAELLLAPANRADILVQLGPGPPVQLVHKPYNRGSRREPPRPEPLLTIVPPANTRPLPLPARLDTIPRLSPELATRRRKLTLALPSLRAAPADICRAPICARLGELELWEVVNPDTMDHTLHLHTWYFQILNRNGRPPPFPAWHDTINLRPGDRVELLIPFRDFTGRTVYHCHIAEHGDIGMMGVIEVSA
jgi:FtsP/CotA-like multicopper oxidase with cupredoxin domain